MQTRKSYIGANDKVGIDAIVGMAGRNFECAIGGGQGEDTLFRWLLGKDDAEPRLIASGVTVRRVVHLKNNVRAGFDELGLTGTKNFGRLAGSVANEKIAGKGTGVGLLFCFDLRSSEKDAGLLSTEPVRAGFAHVRNDVMNHHAIGGANLGGLNPFVFGESGGNDDVLVVDHAGSGHVVRDRQLVNSVGLADAPAFDPIDGRRHVCRIAFGRAGVSPLCECFDFGGAQAHGVGKFSVTVIGKPRRHFACLYSDFHGHGPGARLLIGEHGKGTRFTRAMADLAIFLEDERDVFAERGSRYRSHGGRGGGRCVGGWRRVWVRGRDCGLRKRQCDSEGD